MSGWLERVIERLHLGESIKKRLRTSFLVVMLIMLLPALLSLVILQNYGVTYHQIIERVGQVARLRPLISEQVPDALFMMVAGKVTPEDGQADALLDDFEEQFASLLAGNEEQTELLVVSRTRDTLKNYIQRLKEMALREDPVSDQEVLLDEIRSVASLMGAMLDSYASLEIQNATDTSAKLQADLQTMTVIEVAFLLLALLSALLAQSSLSEAMRRPISGLEKLAASLAAGNLSARAQRVQLKELEPLAQSLNTMADDLELLIAENKREQENLKKSEMRTLQAQIAPHFLYNTLDTIVWLAQTERVDEAVRVTKALSRFFRVSLSQGRDWITMGQEVSHIESYLMIQKVRYRDILDYEIRIDDALLPMQILKLTIQPIVENAIYHGIKHRREGGKIWVEGHADVDRILISVRDNGIGMTRERLCQVRDMLEERTPVNENDMGYGLYNVNKRLKMFYGMEEGLRIVSSEQEGTTVSFHVPEREWSDAECIHRG